MHHCTHFVPIPVTLFPIGKGEKEDVYLLIPYGSVTLELISKRAVEGGLSDLINTWGWLGKEMSMILCVCGLDGGMVMMTMRRMGMRRMGMRMTPRPCTSCSASTPWKKFNFIFQEGNGATIITSLIITSMMVISINKPEVGWCDLKSWTPNWRTWGRGLAPTSWIRIIS